MKFSHLFSDHAILQREKPVPVWGWCQPDAFVRCRLADVTRMTKADQDGKFFVIFPPMPAGGSYTLEAWSGTPEEHIVSKDITFGEVYLASGQSNMEFHTRDCGPYREEALKDTENPDIRLIEIPHTVGVKTNPEAVWQLCTRESADPFSAVGLVFAKEMNKALGVPVGIIHSSWGGSRAEIWISRERIMRNVDFRDALKQEDFNSQNLTLPTEERIAELKKICPNFCELSPLVFDFLIKLRPVVNFGENAEELPFAEKDFDDEAWPTFKVPNSWMLTTDATYGYIWFRKTIQLPAHCAGKPAHLHLGGIDKQDVTFVNGTQVGATGKNYESDYWNTPRDYEIPAGLLTEGSNSIAIRTFCFNFDGSFNRVAREYYLECDGEIISVAGEWKMHQSITYDKSPLHYLNVPGVPPPMGAPSGCSSCYEGMIYPLLPFAIRGAIWYQGESNANFNERNGLYERLMRDLILDWRDKFQCGDFSFYQVLLAGFYGKKDFDAKETWPTLREAQIQVFKDVPNTGIASAMDAGDESDIHPKDKITVGKRLAIAALYNDFHIGTVPMGPLYREFQYISKTKVQISFDYAKGLHSKNGKVEGFYYSYDNVVFNPAKAEIVDDSIVLDIPGAFAPRYFRYAWANYPAFELLYNQEGLPMMPFRSDS